MDDLFRVYADDQCDMCGGHLLEDDQPLTLVESGKMVPMRKDPNFLAFAPDDDQADAAVVNVYHAQCMVATAMHEWGNFGPLQCASCGKYFLKQIPRWAFRFRLGGVGLDEAFVVDEDPANCAQICAVCFSHFFGLDEALNQ